MAPSWVSYMHIAQRFSRSRFFKWIREYEISFSASVPTMVNMLLNDPPPEADRNVPSLRPMTCSTAPLSPDQWKLLNSCMALPCFNFTACRRQAGSVVIDTAGAWALSGRMQNTRSSLSPMERASNVPQTSRAKSPLEVLKPVWEQSLQRALWRICQKRASKPVILGMMDDDGFVTVTGRTKDLIIRGGVNIAPLEIDNVLLRNPKIRKLQL